MLVDAGWMEEHGYSTSLRSQYVKADWLTQPTRGTYKRPLGALTWERVVASLQNLLGHDLHVGGRTALELQGYAHYVSMQGPSRIHLYSDKTLPGWLIKLPLQQQFKVHRREPLFSQAGSELDNAVRALGENSVLPMRVATPERAFLEMFDELSGKESFHNTDMIAEGLRTLSPRRLKPLLAHCNSIKVKRLFFWFADRHHHSWLKALGKADYDLGSGKRMLVKGGRLDPTYLITVQDDLNVPV
ncbi:type IV toxin-antitoxin system AbiEi family antitoxin domain-containing protein [Brucella sp.]|uniref:type IV toxin-antitoxin system AbiEi family antitoxin domain-containing protein n=1 Tax=Brucella sp. TaxID=52132 RepID=UPI00391DE773